MGNNFEMITVNTDNLDKQGFFCYMSKRKTPGYQQKREWMAARLAEGLKLHMIHEIGGRTVGFIEYIPSEVAWRAVHAPGYLLIHCLWVVGKGKGKGYGAHLIQTCLNDARTQGKHGVAIRAEPDGVAQAVGLIENSFGQLVKLKGSLDGSIQPQPQNRSRQPAFVSPPGASG